MSGEERETKDVESQVASEDELDAEGMDDEALDRYLEETPDESESESTGGEESDDSTQTDDSTEDTASSESDPVAEMREELERLKKQVHDKERYIQERGAEIGELRKQLKEEAERLREEVPDLLSEDPSRAVENVLLARERESRAVMLEAEAIWEKNKREITSSVPNFEDRVDEIAEIAKGDGVPAEAVRAFKANPYATSPALLRSLLKRADDSKELSTLREKLKKEREDKDSVADRIARAATRSAGVTGKTSGSVASDDRFKDITEDEIDGLSDAELDALLEREA